MNKPKGHKGQGRRSKSQPKGSRAPARHKPGVLKSWEDFNESAMDEYLRVVEREFAEQLDDFEQALRGEN